ncbi:MAG: tetratricopeptide repeat protein [Gemmatimonadaceae bacterium]|nr:tetratricopeptide repeat protein [Gemmatimonadaceae bacterium]
MTIMEMRVLQPLAPVDAMRADLARLAGDGPAPARLAERLPIWLDLATRLGRSSARPILDDVLADVAEMERAGALQLALTTVSRLRDAVSTSDLAGQAQATAHFGRVLRQLGALDQAKESYERALSSAKKVGDAGLTAHALLGLGTTAHHRGNYPVADSAYRRALTVAPRDSLYEFGANQGLMITRAVLGNLADAFRFGWRAYDLARDNAEQSAEILVNLSGLALRVGSPDSAANGFQVAYHRTTLERVRLPALRGAARAAALRGDKWELEVVTERARVEGMRSSMPYEYARMLRSVGDDELATSLADEATVLADRFGFHEVPFAATHRLTAPQAPSESPVEPVEDYKWRDDAAVTTGIRRLAVLA